LFKLNMPACTSHVGHAHAGAVLPLEGVGLHHIERCGGGIVEFQLPIAIGVSVFKIVVEELLVGAGGAGEAVPGCGKCGLVAVFALQKLVPAQVQGVAVALHEHAIVRKMLQAVAAPEVVEAVFVGDFDHGHHGVVGH
jgi:hypothetical protein